MHCAWSSWSRRRDKARIECNFFWVHASTSRSERKETVQLGRNNSVDNKNVDCIFLSAVVKLSFDCVLISPRAFIKHLWSRRLFIYDIINGYATVGIQCHHIACVLMKLDSANHAWNVKRGTPQGRALGPSMASIYITKNNWSTCSTTGWNTMRKSSWIYQTFQVSHWCYNQRAAIGASHQMVFAPYH